MNDYIKREDAINALYEECNKDQSLSCPNQFFDGIARIPAADVRENVHGHWILHEDDWYGDYWECSACHDEYIVYEGAMYYKHCPTCGAVMDGGNEQ